MAREIESLGEAKNIREAKEFLCEFYSYSKQELEEIFSDHEIMRMVDEENLAESNKSYVVSDTGEGVSDESIILTSTVIESILKTVNKNPEYLKYYDMISGEVFFVGRKVTFSNKRYSVLVQDFDRIILTDTVKIVMCNKSEVNVVSEDLNQNEMSKLFSLCYNQISNNKNIGICAFFETFVNIYDLNIKGFYKFLDLELIELIESSLRSYASRNNLRVNFIK